ncbi:hypothetical protein LCGC14_0906880 [marine sediment metagenome]|uniref:Helix-turn-helix domain-containing protein n=1 Tax=marine sediment metagenome TaxID=412755 RepID=A0A0F9S1N4_9ZZZZ
MKPNPDPSPPVWVSLTELAQRWNVSKRTVTRILFQRLPWYNLPHQRRYRLEDIIRYERSRVASNVDAREMDKET